MSIEKDYNKYFVTCDNCGDTEGEFETFEDAVDFKKDLGWKSKKSAEGWKDLCPNCQYE